MIRFRLYYNKDTETEWLNKMAAILLAARDSISPVIHMVLQIFAIILMVAGLVLTVKQRE